MAKLDSAFSAVKSLGGTLRFFRHGWGANENRHTTWLDQIRTRTLPPPQPLDITWRTIPTTDWKMGTFRSPCSTFLPPESANARVLHVPAPDADTLVIHLAATGDHGFVRRLLTCALWLRARGISSLVLESPFYGSRRPGTQKGALLQHVHELPDLGRATIEESIALLNNFRRSGHTRQAITGMSQGGLHAAMVASLCEWPVGVVAAFAPHSAAPVFTDGVLSDVVDWGALGGDTEQVRQRLKRVLSITDISNFPYGDGSRKEVLVFAKDDRYISQECVDAWRAARPSNRVKWVPGGHVSGAIWYYPAIRDSILEVIPPDREGYESEHSLLPLSHGTGEDVSGAQRNTIGSSRGSCSEKMVSVRMN